MCLRMDRNLRRIVSWWVIVVYSFTSPAESRLAQSRGSDAVNPPAPVRTFEQIQPRLSATKQQSVEHSVQHRPVMVRCHPDSMEVVVQADLFDTGHKVDGRHLRLGLNSLDEDGECGAVPSGEEEFTILAWLTDCGTKLSSTKEKLIYSNVLTYTPEPSSDGLLRLDEANIPVECHYGKRYSVDGISLQPAWVPSVSVASVDDQIDFTLRIMTGDWQFERGSYAYFLGDPIHFEVSAVMGNHMPLRVYVDHCVATATPDAEAALRHDFIGHHGCLADAYLTNSNSRFLPRVEEHKLRFQLEAFRFYQEPGNQVYITCHVKAVPVTLAVSSQNRACSLIGNRWRSVDGNDQACTSCDISQWVEETPDTEPPKTVSALAWPPLISQESIIQNEVEHPASYVFFRPESHKSQHTKPQQSSKFIKRDTDYKDRPKYINIDITMPTSTLKDPVPSIRSRVVGSIGLWRSGIFLKFDLIKGKNPTGTTCHTVTKPTGHQSKGFQDDAFSEGKDSLRHGMNA